MTSIATRQRLAAILVALAWATPLWSFCETTAFEDVPMTVCTVDPATDDLRLWQRGPDGTIYGTFERLSDDLEQQGLTLRFAMNGGMYHDNREPVGLFIGDEGTVQSLITSAGPGNFGMLPNGVLCIGTRRAEIIETTAFSARQPECRYASQSGPMLVIDGSLHPRFIPDSTSEFIRNGVGIRDDGTLLAVISDRPVNFHRFARFFRDALGTPNALYIDGKVSRLYAPALNRNDFGFPIGPILGVVQPLD